MGAMENAGCVTFRDEMIFRSRQTRSAYESRANTILHEMAHMWFGDLVTMKWWDDLWLNESFAEWAAHYASTAATKYDEAWTSFCNARKTWAYRQDQLPSTHPIAADNYDLEAVEVNFDGITYAKGASALRQLVAWVGEEEFLAGLAQLLRGARLRQLRAHRPAGRPRVQLRPRARVVGEGVAADLRRQHGAAGLRGRLTDGTFTSFTIHQTAHPDFPTLRRHRLGVGLYDLTDAGPGPPYRPRDRRGRRRHGRARPGRSAAARPRAAQRRRPELHEGAPRRAVTAATVVDHIDAFAESLPRALCWGAAWDMTRDAEMRATRLGRPRAARHRERDRHDGAPRPRRADRRGSLTSYAAPENRDEVSGRWDDGHPRLGARRPSPAATSSSRSCGRSPRRGGVDGRRSTCCRGCSTGRRTLDGLAVDVDLRWTLLPALASGGREPGTRRSPPSSTATTPSRDRRAQRRPGRRCRRPQAKAQAWNDAVVRDDVANETMRSIAYSFGQPRQDEVLAAVRRALPRGRRDHLGRAQRPPGLDRAGATCSRARSPPSRRWTRSTPGWTTRRSNPAARRYVARGSLRPRTAPSDAQRKDASRTPEPRRTRRTGTTSRAGGGLVDVVRLHPRRAG